MALSNLQPNLAIDLSGLSFVNGIRFEFPPGTTLEGGESGLLVRSHEAYRNTFELGRKILGQYEGSLSNGGERLRMEDEDGNGIVDFEFDDAAPWPIAADGEGSSLVLIQSGERSNPNLSTSWRSQIPQPKPVAPIDGNADRDQDGLNALLEYALGTRDDDPDSGWETIQYSVERVDIEGVTDDHFVIRFLPNPTVTDVVIVPEAITHLDDIGWQAGLLTEVKDSENSQGWKAYHTRHSIQRQNQTFVRLHVQLIP